MMKLSHLFFLILIPVLYSCTEKLRKECNLLEMSVG